MVSTVTLVLDFVSLFATLVGLILLLRYRGLLRGRLASKGLALGFIFLSAVLFDHCILEVLDMEVEWTGIILRL